MKSVTNETAAHSPRLSRLSNSLLSWRIWKMGWVRVLSLVLAGVLSVLAVAVEMGLPQQMMFAAFCVIVALLLHRVGGRLATLTLVMLSVITSLRYMYWRVTDTIGFHNVLDAFFGYGLLLADGEVWQHQRR